MITRFEKHDIADVWVAESNVSGPTVSIFGGVHGDELTGIEIVKKTLEEGIDIDAGTVYLALGNVAAIEAGVRHTGTNLNRCFRDLSDEETDQFAALPYELRRAQELIFF